MRRPFNRFFQWSAPVVLLGLGACSSLSESQCIAGDWETVGFTDGAAGRSQSMLLEHQDACVKHGAIPNRQRYLDGWTQGIRNYCTPENGFSVGDRGASYGNVCPTDLEPAFYAALLDGRRLFNARSEINDLQRRIAFKEKRLAEVKKKQVANTAEVISATATELRRIELLAEIKDLAEEQGKLEEEIASLHATIAVKRDRLDDLRHALAYNG